MNKNILELRNVTKTYKKGKGKELETVRAVSNVSMTLKKQNILSLVGESGSGKTTLARLITGIERPDSGAIDFEGNSIEKMRGRSMRKFRRQVQMIFQDPFSSINPLNTVSYTLGRPLINHLSLSKSAARQRVKELLNIAHLSPVDEYLEKLPYELSGGQLQRVGIVRALASNPSLIIADEPVSMLDVSIRAEILNLLDELRRNEDVTLIYISHDLVSARALADKIVVLYRGKIVEQGDSSQVVQHPKHPYTKLLLDSIPNPWKLGNDLSEIKGSAGDPTPETGCVFRNRCPFAMKKCEQSEPKLVPLDSQQSTACFLHSNEMEPENGMGVVASGAARS